MAAVIACRGLVDRSQTTRDLLGEAVHRVVQRLELVDHRRLILRRIGDERFELGANKPGDRQYDRERQRDGDGDSGDLWQSSPL